MELKVLFGFDYVEAHALSVSDRWNTCPSLSSECLLVLIILIWTRHVSSHCAAFLFAQLARMYAGFTWRLTDTIIQPFSLLKACSVFCALVLGLRWHLP